MKEALLGIARHILTAAGGALVAKGTVDAVAAEQLVGALVTLLGVIASVLDKRLRK